MKKDEDEDLKKTIKTCVKIGLAIACPPYAAILVGKEVIKRLAADEDKKNGR